MNPEDSLWVQRERGVETRLIFGGAPTDRDETLIQNIARAYRWYCQIKSGKTLGEIARASDTSTRRIHQIIELAFLAPDLLKKVLDGQQPLGFTSEWCKYHGLPGNWQDQRAIFETL